jgi:hypothetical protein
MYKVKKTWMTEDNLEEHKQKCTKWTKICVTNLMGYCEN